MIAIDILIGVAVVYLLVKAYRFGRRVEKRKKGE